MTWLFRRLAWALARDDLKETFYRAKVSALGFFILIWVPVVALSFLLPHVVQDMALLSSFPVTGTVFWFGLRHAVKDGPPPTLPALDATARRSLWRLAGGYVLFIFAIGFALARLAG